MAGLWGLEWDTVPALFLGASLLFVAIWLLYLDSRHRVHRALALFLAILALYRGLFPFSSGGVPGPAWFLEGASRARDFAAIILPFAAMYFVYEYRRRYASAAASRFVPLMLAGLAGLVVAAMALIPTWQGFDLGDSVIIVTFALLGYMFLRDRRRAVEPHRRAGGLLGCVAFVAPAAFLSTDFITSAWIFAAKNIRIGALGWIQIGIVGYALFVTGVMVYQLAMEVWLRPARLRRGPRRALILIMVAAALGVLAQLPVAFGLKLFPVERILSTLSTFTVALFLTYAIAKHQLFDLDLKLRVTIRRGALASIFLAVIFIVAQVVQNVTGSAMGVLMGGIAGGILLFALNPLQRFAERLAETALPDADGSPAYVAFKKFEVYREALEGVYVDGNVTPKERGMLERLRAKLDIDALDAKRLEAEISRPKAPAVHSSAGGTTG